MIALSVPPAAQPPPWDEPPSASARREMLMRARWLAGLGAEERDALAEASLREVEARFAAWVDATGALGDDPPG